MSKDAERPDGAPTEAAVTEMADACPEGGVLTPNPFPEGKGNQNTELEQRRSEAEESRYASLVNYPKCELDAARYTAPTDDEVTRKLELIPPEPGVYLLRDKAGKVLYVGKAKSLRPRVRAYFREFGDTRF